MDLDCDALVIGAGPAGAAAAILLAQAGWRVVMVEQHSYPRRKVCGECIAAGNLPLLDDLGIGAAFRAAAGPELREIGWMDADTTVRAAMPPCAGGPYAYGRALGRDRLDVLLLSRALALGVEVRQPARVRAVDGRPGRFVCHIDPTGAAAATAGVSSRTLCTAVLIDAHGSWERGPVASEGGERRATRAARRDSDLFAFKANFRDSTLEPGFLPVLALPGGYGGMVVGDDGRTTLACCIRRDALTAARRNALPGVPAGIAVERFVRDTCAGVRRALDGAVAAGPWLSVGPLRPGIRVDAFNGAFRIGNAAGESHPLIGEGISMALQSAALLALALAPHPAPGIAGAVAARLNHSYAAAWRRAFAPRLRLSALYAHLAMRPALARPARALLLDRWPSLLSAGARLAGKATRAAATSYITAETA